MFIMADSMSLNTKKKSSLRRVGLVVLLLVAFLLRVWNLDWDEGTHQHPDERYWSIVTADIQWEDPVTYFNSEDSELNPYRYRSSWVYGTLPLFAAKGAAEFLEADFFLSNWVVSAVDSVGINLKEDRLSANGEMYVAKTFNSGFEVQNIGRLLAALIDTGTVLLTYFLGRALFSRAAGLIAATLLTFAPIHIQYSHFHGAEPWVTFFGTAAVLLSVLFYKSYGTLGNGDPPKRCEIIRALSIGFFCGLAGASKFTGFIVFTAPVFAFALTTFTNNWDKGTSRARRSEAFFSFVTLVSVSGLMAIGTFRVFQPYAFSNSLKLHADFVTDLKYLQDVNKGGDFPWVIQWVDRLPLFAPLKSMLWSGMGPGISVCVLIGIVFVCREILHRKDFSLLIPISFVIALGALVTTQFNPLNRYYLPVYPMLIACGGFGIHRLWVGAVRRLKSQQHDNIVWGSVALFCSLTMGVVLIWGAGFVNGVYQKTHPRLAASSWVTENIPAGALISRQVWDDAVPIRSADLSERSYALVEFDLFRSDSSIDQESGLAKPEVLLAQLDEVDYIIESSNRIYDSIPRMPAEYPSTVAYYEALFNEQLGFSKIASFENKPSLLGFDFPSWGSEETFSVYDHPAVTIWEKSDDWDVEKARRILNPFAAANAPNLLPREGTSNALLLEPSQYRSMQSGDTFDERFSSGIFAGSFGWLWWFLWLQISALLVLPSILQLCQSLPDRGYGLSKVFGFLAIGTITWILVSWDVVNFSRFAVVVSSLIMLATCLWQLSRNRSIIKDFFLHERRTWVTVEIIFAGVFFAVLALRFLNPDMWDAFRGGEKPMEMGYLTAIGRSENLPPYDPWFAGGVMNYYYFGWFLLAVPMVALGLQPEFVFQFGLATYVSLAVLGVLTIIVNLVSYARERTSFKPPVLSGAIRTGILASFLFAIAGTFDGVRRYHAQFREVDKWNLLSGWPVVGDCLEFLGGFVAWLQGTPLPSYDWWGPSRVNTGNFDITEFPFFTFLFGDLHPHLMGMPVFTLLIALSMAYVFSCQGGRFIHSVVLAAMLGLTIAISKMTNTWDMPTLCLIAVVAFVFGSTSFRLKALSSVHNSRLAESILWLVASASVALGAFVSGLGWVTAISAMFALTTGVSIFASDEVRLRLLIFVRHLFVSLITFMIFVIPYDQARETFDLGLRRTSWVSPFSDFLSHWGVFFFIALVFICREAHQRLKGRSLQSIFDVRHFHSKRNVLNFWLYVIYALIALSLGLLIGWALALSAYGAAVSVHLLVLEILGTRSVQKIGTFCLWALGFAILAGPEIFVVSNDVERMNTVFKFWLQGWTLLALASALSVQIIYQSIRVERKNQVTSRRLSFASLWSFSLVMGLIIVIVYPLSSIGPRLDARFAKDLRTLNGLSYLSTEPVFARYDNGLDAEPSIVRIGEDLELINWLRSSVSGSPTIVEWTGLSYDWNSRIAVHTGLPTVLGWSSHQRQQRTDYQDMISQRKFEVQNFYTLKDHKYMTDFLLSYGVSYVIVGVQERRFVSSDALKYLGEHPGIRRVFSDDLNSIYRVDEVILWELTEAASLN